MVLLMIGSLRLFDAGLYYSSQAQQNALAVRIAQSTLSEIRIWARTPNGGGLAYDDWSPWSGYDQPHPEESGYRIRVRVADRELKSPSSQLEESFPLLEQKVLAESCKLVEIRVSWKSGEREFILTSLVADPPRPLPITVQVEPAAGSPPTLARDASADFRARAVDAKNNEIKDVFFHWNVKPGQTHGGIVAQRTGSSATFTHAVVIPNRPTLYTAGAANVEASTVYHGRPTRGESDPFTLNP